MADEVKTNTQENNDFVPTWVTVVALITTMVIVLVIILKI
jgi:hypothetical protein